MDMGVSAILLKLNSSRVKLTRMLYQLLSGFMMRMATFSGTDLEIMIHNEAPWINARGDIEGWEPSTQEISSDDIKMYCRGLKKLVLYK